METIMDRRTFTLTMAATVAGWWRGQPRLSTSGGDMDLSGVGRREPIIGMNVQPTEAGEMLRYVRDLRITHVRTSWWHWLSPRDWAWLDDYRSAGVDVLPLLYAAPGGSGVARYDALRRAFGPFPWIQIDNEPEGEVASYSRGLGDGRRYRRLADHIRSRDPGTRILAPGLAWTQPAVLDYLRGMIEGSAGAFDALSYHIYGDHAFGEPMSRWRLFRKLGWEGPIWSSELGQRDVASRAYLRNTGQPVNQRTIDAWQAECWRRALTEDPSRHQFERIYAFQLTPDDHGYGILRRDRTPRPAYEWLRRHNAGGAGPGGMRRG
jgi:hypothetical protein